MIYISSQHYQTRSRVSTVNVREAPCKFLVDSWMLLDAMMSNSCRVSCNRCVQAHQPHAKRHARIIVFRKDWTIKARGYTESYHSVSRHDSV